VIAKPAVDLSLGHVRFSSPSNRRTVTAGAEYGPAEGDPRLREAIAVWEGVSAGEVGITTGASLGLVATLATLERPCSVLCPRPFYPAYPKLAGFLGLEVLFYELGSMRGWQPDPEAFERLIRSDTRAVLWNFPNNPTGAVPSRAVLEAIREVFRKANLLVLSDEAYADFVFDGEPFPDMRAAFGPESVVRLRSFSKILQMPGERLGYVVTDPDRLRSISRNHWLLALSPPATAQAVALLELRSDLSSRLQELCGALGDIRARGARLLDGCDRIRFIAPPAGFFFWIEVLDCPVDSRTLARLCSSEAGVAVQPGAVFGVEEPVYLRASFAVEPEEAIRGLEALVEFLRRL
jgi:aminotransferase